MADTALSRLAALREKNKQMAEAANTAPALSLSEADDEEKKKKGFFAGAGYLAEKTAVGFMQSIEGIVDFTVGGIADLIGAAGVDGAHEWAEKQFTNSWFGDWYSHPDEWYDAGAGMKIAGDVFSGIGTSIPTMLATLGVGFATGGAGAAAMAAGVGVGGFSAAGSGVSEAVSESGKLTGKEYLYGAMSGATEAGLELVTGKLGTGVARVAKDTAKRFGKEVTETVAKSGAKHVFKELGKEFASEGFEEGMSAIVEPVWKKITYDHDAEANPFKNYKEIGYSALVGGLSGALMGGANISFYAGVEAKQGSKIFNKGETESVLNTAETILNQNSTPAAPTADSGSDAQPSAADGENAQVMANGDEQDGIIEALSQAYKEYKDNEEKGKGDTLKQKRLLARIRNNSTMAIFSPVIKNSALKALHNAEAVAERYNSLGLKDANGNPITVTAAEIREGVDINSRKSIVKALKTNETLRTLAVMDAVGQLVMGTGAFAENAITAHRYVTQDDINHFVKTADSQTFAEVSKALGITPDEWRSIDAKGFNAKMEAYADSEEGSANIERIKRINEAKKLPESEAKQKLPISPRTQKNGSIKRYKTDKANIAIIKDNSTYTLYDYDSNKASRRLSLAEVQAELDKLRGENSTQTTNDNVVVIEENSELAERIANSSKSKYDVIAEYIFEQFGGKTFTFSDGRKATMDKRDSHKISSNANRERTIQLGNLRKLLENAKFDNSEYKVEHPKFTAFHYYTVTAKIGKEEFPLWINVGVAKNDGSNHIYDITNNSGNINKEEAPTHNGVSRPVGYAIQNASSNNIISNPDEKINPSDEKISKTENSKEKSLASEYRSAEAFARKNIPDYDKLYAPVKRAIERTIVEARANGLTEADMATFAKFSAKSGINVGFDKTKLKSGLDENGNQKYANGLFDGDNTIYINKDSKRKFSSVLFHELMHSLVKNALSKGEIKLRKQLMNKAYKKMPKERREQIEKEYKAYYKKNNLEFTEDIKKDEIAAHYTEDIFGEVDVLEYLEGEVPGLGKRIIGFFNEAARTYSGDENLSREARKYARKFRELYNQVEERHKGMNATVGVNSGERMAVDIDNLTEEQYNNFGWVRANDILTADEYKNFTTEFAKAKTSEEYAAYKTPRGEYMIAVGKMHGAKEGVKNRIVFAKGDIESPQITRVIKIKSYKETKLDDKRRELYAFGRRGIQPTTGGILTVYTRANVRNYVQYRGSSGSNVGHNNQLGANRGAGSSGTQKAQGAVRSPLTPLVHTFRDVAGRKRNVLKINGEYMIEGDNHSRYQPTIEAAVNAENERVIARYAKKYNTTTTRVKGRLESNPDFLKTERNNGKRFALDLDDLPDTTESVGAERKGYAPGIKDRVFNASTNLYIDTVDELYGVHRYLDKVGKRSNSAATLNMARSSRSQAQTMIGSVQYDLFADEVKELGEGIQKILAPINTLEKGKDKNIAKVERAERSKAFDDYMLHLMNIDRMTLEENSIAEHNEDVKKLAELEAKLEQAVKDYEAAQKALEKLKGKRDKKAVLERKKLRDRMAKAKGYTKKLSEDIRPLKLKVDSFKPLKNKPVFGINEGRAEAVTAEQSRAIVARYEQKYPEFKEIAEKVYKYLDNNQKMRVDAGLITQEAVDYMKKLYPHYVPTYRDTSYSGAAAVKGAGNVEVSSTIRRAKGSGQNILSLQNSIAEQTQQLIRAANINRIATEIYETALESGDTEYVQVISKEKVKSKDYADMQADATDRPKKNQITFYYKGEKITMAIARELFLGFEGLYKPSVDFDSVILQTLKKVNTTYKTLITQYSPAFAIRNIIRDLQDAGINTKHGALFVKNYGTAWKDILSNSEDWKLYRAMGGFSSTVFTTDGLEARVGSRGFTDLKNIFDNASDLSAIKATLKAIPKAFNWSLEAIGNLNAMLEQVTRFAEFKASIEAGDSPQVALYNSAEVTTNFGRRGRLTKVLNATVMPFLNPAIQGFDKMFRNVKDAATSEELMKAIASIIGKLFLLGILPILANSLMYGGDEDYEQLREADKENNFLFKYADGKFIKIPRGRVAGVFGGAVRRIVLTAQGKDADWKEYVDNAISQVTPVENVSRTIFSPFTDVITNTTWYGTAIEGREFEDTAPRDRYDESTSDIAIAIGQAINYSPKKIHYLLDQYTGVIGDFALPATTAKNKGTVGDQLKSYGKNFVIDAETSNKISAKFYELYDEVQYAKTDYDKAVEAGTDKPGDEAIAFKLRYLNRVKKNVSSLYKEKKAIQANAELSAIDRLGQARVIQGLINEAQKNAMADIDDIDRAIAVTASIEDEGERFAEVTRIVYGAESALETYNEKVYEKAQLCNAAGLNYDDYYYYYFSVKGIEADKDKDGNSVAGTKRTKVINAIKELGLDEERTLLLIAASGYSLKDGDLRGVSAARANKLLLRYIMKQKLSKAEKAELAEQCGFKVKNGKILLKN